MNEKAIPKNVINFIEEFSRISENDTFVSRSDILKAMSLCEAKLGEGATRFCVVFNNWDYVIKIPRLGNVKYNYCDRELSNYELAKKYRVERICLPIELYGEAESGIPLYIQPKYTTSSNNLSERKKGIVQKKINKLTTKPIFNKIRSSCFDGYRINSLWLARVTQLYGKKFMLSFEKWLEEAKINDLHEENTGYLDNKPIILDYAGYHEYDSEISE